MFRSATISKPARAAALVAAVLTAGSLVIPSAAQATVTTTNLVPASLTTTQGRTGGQPVAVLGTADQSGSQDDWDKYLELERKYTGYAAYAVPSFSGEITGITVKANYRGPGLDAQKWTWQLYDWQAGTWVSVGTNAAAPDWGDWKLLSFEATGPLDRFVSSADQVLLQVESSNGRDSADIDYLGVELTIEDGSNTGGDGALVTGGATLNPPVVDCDGCWKPEVNTSWNWVIAHVPTAPFRDVQMYDIDGFEATAADVAALHDAGIKAVCYISGGTAENWRPDYASFPASLKGAEMEEWAGEFWLDISDVQKKNSALASIMNARLQMCADKGFDAVEWDNVDAALNAPADTGLLLTEDDQLIYNQFLFNNTHALGLSVLLKNDPSQAAALVDYADGTLNEECNVYSECGELDVFVAANKPVFNAEYVDNTAFCAADNAADFNGVRFALELDDSVYVACR